MNSLVTYPTPTALQVSPPPAGPPPESDGLDVGSLFEAARRRYVLFLVVAGVVLALAVVLTLRQSPTYTGSASVMMDPRQLQLFQQATSPNVSGDLSLSAEAVGTQVEIIKSRAIAERVVEQLRLDQDPRFQSGAGKVGLRGRLMASIGSLFGGRRVVKPLTPEQRHEAIVDLVMSHVVAERLGLTYLISINYVDPYPDRAAAVANAYASAYIDQSLQGKSDATRQAGGYLNSRLHDLSDQAAHDAAMVQTYKVSHNLLGSEGSTLTEQEISNLNQQIATARAEAVADQARVDTARTQLAHGSNGEDVGASLESPVVSNLRANRAVVSGTLAQLSSRYGPKFPDVLKAQSQLQDIDAQIKAEITRVISNLQARAQVSSQRLSSLERTLNQSKGTLAGDTRAQAGLVELQQKATASQTLYDNYLARFKEIMASAGTEQSDARIVSVARVPTAPTSPRIVLDLALGVVLALVAGVVSGLIAEIMDRSFASAPDVERRLHTNYLGSIPLLASVARGNKRSPTDYVMANPFSVFAEAFRNLRVSIIQAHPVAQSTVVAITSPLTGEGKTTTSVCLGETASMQGARTIIVDCDLRRRTLQRFLEESPKVGLVEVIMGEASLDEALVKEPLSGVTYLPLAHGKLLADDILGGEAMGDLLDELRRRYDFIILDTAPILALADARILASRSDVVVVLCRWRKTPEDAIKSALRLLHGAGAPLAGVVLTRVDVRKQAAHGYGDSTYYYRETQQYHVS